MNVLILDTDEVAATKLAKHIGILGFNTDISFGDTDIITLLERKNYNLIFLEFYLRNVNGIQLLSDIRKHKKYDGIKVVVLTTTESFPLIYRFMKLGADDYLLKPCSIASIQHRVLISFPELLREQSPKTVNILLFDTNLDRVETIKKIFKNEDVNIYDYQDRKILDNIISMDYISLVLIHCTYLESNLYAEISKKLKLGFPEYPKTILITDYNNVKLANSYMDENIVDYILEPEFKQLKSIVKLISTGLLDSLQKNYAKSRSILIVSMDVDEQKQVETCLNEQNYKTKFASNFKDAFDTVSKSKIHLVFLDLDLPRHEGYLLLAMINDKRELRSIPIIATSKYSDHDHITKALHAGVNDYIVKPFNKDTIISHVDAFFRL